MCDANDFFLPELDGEDHETSSEAIDVDWVVMCTPARENSRVREGRVGWCCILYQPKILTPHYILAPYILALPGLTIYIYSDFRPSVLYTYILASIYSLVYRPDFTYSEEMKRKEKKSKRN